MNTRHLRQLAWASVSGLLFAVGLVVSGMTQPAKVLGFLNLAGLAQGVSSTAQPGFWDPSLAFVMAGALLVTLLAFHYTPQRTQPTAGDKFHLPTRGDIDRRLLLGAALFGLGWGLVGYCPGPALASVLVGGTDTLMFVVAMLLGMWAAKRFAS